MEEKSQEKLKLPIKKIEKNEIDFRLFNRNYMKLIMIRSHKDFSKEHESKQLLIAEEFMGNKKIIKPFYNLNEKIMENIFLCSEKLRASIQNACDAYYHFSSKEEDNDLNKIKNIKDLNNEELKALNLIESFDIEYLNLYKNLSKEEEEALKFCKV